MSIDNRTEHLNLPLPHQDNLLEVDVLRLRESLERLDIHAEQIDEELADKADATATAIALAERAMVEDMDAVRAALLKKSDAASTQAAIAGHAARTAATEVGHVRLATDAEAAAGEAADTAITPRQLGAATSPARNDRAAAYTSAGNSAGQTGFKLLDGADIGTLFGKIDDVTLNSTGSGGFVQDIAVSVSGKTAQITKTMRAAAYCSYCGYCTYCNAQTYCTYCSHCYYCTYCQFECQCNCGG